MAKSSKLRDPKPATDTEQVTEMQRDARKHMGQAEVEEFAAATASPEQMDLKRRWPKLFVWLGRPGRVFRWVLGLVSKISFKIIHWSARAAGQPLVDLGQSYSPATLNERVTQLEVMMLNQWTNLKEDDFLTPDDEIKMYVAACHVARQYDRITAEMLTKRMGISRAKAMSLIDQMQRDEVLTEEYTETFYDTRRSSIDEVISRHVAHLRKIAPEQVDDAKKKRVN